MDTWQHGAPDVEVDRAPKGARKRGNFRCVDFLPPEHLPKAGDRMIRLWRVRMRGGRGVATNGDEDHDMPPMNS